MSRWSVDDVRLPSAGMLREPEHARIPERSKPELEHSIETLSASREDRERDRATQPRTHHLRLPAGGVRERVTADGREYRIRGSEVDLLERVGQFRAVFVADLARDASDVGRMQTDMRSLERQGLLASRTITRLHERESAHVVSLTPEGKSMLEQHRDLEHERGQEYYAGWVKPAELWHDAGLYRMYRDVETDLEREGGRVLRVIVDDELKARAFRAVHKGKQESEADVDPRTVVASLQGLPLEDGHFVFPDVRLEVEDANGDVRTVDLELVTRHYHGSHLSGKSHAGFRLFRAESGVVTRRGGTPYDPRG